ncbi:hypothetical protein PR202_gb08722 [Eleusine coracana subsp. coracana]|uniref:RING-type domain-containing protein n=1 Tax=Eleusine coracana subsp. coracana TaxID=191504 RepID=A0AAV5EF41_ELECO|nr:hypothetical protein QOZ80_2BG0188790 [Eleusine coracana subsp. coracana]GJN21260.1 hypothetical protein PR202_gb08722 [Eleusine coracana subsp. coracana]
MQEGQHVYYSRRALLTAPVMNRYQENAAASQVIVAPGQSSPAPAAGEAVDVVSGGGASSFDANVVMILAVLLCALICALGLNSIVRCALRCSTTTTRTPPLGADADEQRRLRAEAAAQAAARRKALRAMPTVLYSSEQAAGGACAVCLGDLAPGDRVRVLPKCGHGFHARCVDRWLVARSTCPTCRQPLFGAPPKGSGCAHDAEPAFLVPLRPEALVTPYDF